MLRAGYTSGHYKDGLGARRYRAFVDAVNDVSLGVSGHASGVGVGAELSPCAAERDRRFVKASVYDRTRPEARGYTSSREHVSGRRAVYRTFHCKVRYLRVFALDVQEKAAAFALHIRYCQIAHYLRRYAETAYSMIPAVEFAGEWRFVRTDRNPRFTSEIYVGG